MTPRGITFRSPVKYLTRILAVLTLVGSLFFVAPTPRAEAAVSYATMGCSTAGYWSNAAAYWFMNITTSDAGYCPVRAMFQAAHPSYYPRFGYETNVANDYGWISVRESGECSWSPDTGPYWDFQIPCKAHDYGYDLRRAGFSGTVSDYDVDYWFFYLMEAHCNDRVLASNCRDVRNTYYNFVVGANVTVAPGPVTFRNDASSQCIDVYNGSTASGADLIQYPCHTGQNQRWRITPATDAPGKFRLVAAHSSKCADGFLSGIEQWTCGYNEQLIELWGVNNQDRYTIRVWHLDSGQCFDVPNSSQTPGVQIIRWTCHSATNQTWRPFVG